MTRPPARARRLPALIAVAVLALLVLARPAAAEGAGYDGSAGGLRVRTVTEPATDAQPDGGADRSDGADATVLEVRGGGFLADSRVVVRAGHGPEVTVDADASGAFVARLPRPSAAGSSSAGAERVWVTATGTDPSFARRTVSEPLGGDGPSGIDPAVVVLAAVGALLVAAMAAGPVRSRWAGHVQRTDGASPAAGPVPA